MRNSRVELVTGMTTLITQVDLVLIEHPHMRKYFNDKVSPPQKGETDGERARAIALTMANVLDHVVEHMKKMKWETRSAWRLYIYEVNENSPVLRELLDEHKDWWPSLQRQIDRGYPRFRPALFRRLF